MFVGPGIWMVGVRHTQHESTPKTLLCSNAEFMNGFINRLIDRHAVPEKNIKPRLPGIFEPLEFPGMKERSNWFETPETIGFQTSQNIAGISPGKTSEQEFENNQENKQDIGFYPDNVADSQKRNKDSKWTNYYQNKKNINTDEASGVGNDVEISNSNNSDHRELYQADEQDIIYETTQGDRAIKFFIGENRKNFSPSYRRVLETEKNHLPEIRPSSFNAYNDIKEADLIRPNKNLSPSSDNTYKSYYSHLIKFNNYSGSNRNFLESGVTERPVIKVTIVRIEVRSVISASPGNRTNHAEQKPKVSLDDYLKKRNNSQS